MMTAETQVAPIRTSIDRVERLDGADLHDLCDATDMAILDGGGFGWLEPPPRETLEAFWRGVLAVPERELFVVRLGGTICGSGQLILPSRNAPDYEEVPEDVRAELDVVFVEHMDEVLAAALVDPEAELDTLPTEQPTVLT